MVQKSAGLLMYRKKNDRFEALLVHPGGPYMKNKDQGAWSIPKGLYTQAEDPLDAAKREFEEELGFAPEADRFVELGEIRQKGGKQVKGWAFEGDCDADATVSNTFSLEWPPKSGIMQEFPEVDRARWFDFQTARHKINPGQVPFIDALEDLLEPV
jgi:predicted NUDIX family NTP pyrophosphohydrolase